MIVVVDSGLGNVGSIVNMCNRLNVAVTRSGRSDDIRGATALILPGVGAFDAGMSRLSALGLLEALHERVMDAEVPVLGICLGMQLMTDGSDEGSDAGLGWIRARTRSFKSLAPTQQRLRLPNIGWHYVQSAKPHPMTRGFDDESRFYFVHSYAVVCDDESDLLFHSHYSGVQFAAGFVRRNVIGVQFHPEKSHKFGMQLFRNFFEWCAECQ